MANFSLLKFQLGLHNGLNELQCVFQAARHNTQYSYYVSHSNGPKYVSQTQPMTVFPINLCFDDVTRIDGEEQRL